MDIHVPIRVLRFLQPYIEKLGPFIEDIIRLVEPFAPKFAQTLGKLTQNWPIIDRDLQTKLKKWLIQNTRNHSFCQETDFNF